VLDVLCVYCPCIRPRPTYLFNNTSLNPGLGFHLQYLNINHNPIVAPLILIPKVPSQGSPSIDKITVCLNAHDLNSKKSTRVVLDINNPLNGLTI
jgi:hypothetical protein